MLDQLPHMIWLSRFDGTNDYVSAPVRTYLGLPPDPTVPIDWSRFIHPDDIARVYEDVRVANEHYWPWRGEYRIRRADGSYRWHLGQGVVIRSEDGDWRLGTGTDIQDRLDLEAQLRHVHKMQAVGTLAGGIAHEFNNLLTMILANAALIGDVDERVAQHVGEIEAAGQRAAKLTRQLLAFSRPRPMAAAALALDSVVGNSIATLTTALGQHVELRPKLDGGGAMVVANASQIQTIVMNLVMNARDAMPGGGPITVATRCVDHTAVLEVVDMGCGFDEAVKARVFDPFFTTKRSTNATGLGLTMVYNLVRELGGTIDVESEPGRGSRFSVVLPAIMPVVVGRTATRERAVRAGATVLVVDDSEPVLRALAQMVAHLGYRVVTATSGQDALAQVAANDIDVLITDVSMPGMSGIELAEIVRSIEGIRVILVTGYDPVTTMPSLPQLQKPFTANDLERVVREVLATR
ncbi:MAG TPA: ATP-binding protein [Kofleriaceae bacterium]